MHGTLQPTMRRIDAGSNRVGRALLWASLLPLFLLLRPYEGLIQDARIYIGRGLADRDPTGLGQDILFAADGQTGFTAFRFIVRALLGVLPAAQTSMLLAFVGGLLWLAAAVTLLRGFARGRLAWAAMVCVLALPADYGSFHTFAYGESVATPRVFAEAAVMAALAAILSRRRLVAIGFLVVALAFHPLMTLPGVAIVGIMLVYEDRRWLAAIGAAAGGLAVAALLGLPLADRLLVPMDATWLAILRERSVNLFPSLWPAETYAHIGVRLSAVVVAATGAPTRTRRLLLAVAGTALGGLALTAVLGDRAPLVLVAQLQTWRALWPLALLGNAAVAVAAAALWRAGPGGRLTLAILALAWVSVSLPALAIVLAMLAPILGVAERRGLLAAVPPRVAVIALAAAAVAIGVDVATSGAALVSFLSVAHEAHGEATYSLMLVPAVQAWPLAIGAIVVALVPRGRLDGRNARIAAVGAILVGGMAAAALWDSRTDEYRIVDGRGAPVAELRALIGPEPGPILWIDSYNETWFLADRPAVFDKMQGGPILFSRALALAWHARGTALVRLGLARETDVAPWAKTATEPDVLPLSPVSLDAFCRDPARPAAVVAPGSQLDAVPAGWTAGLWRPSQTIQTVVGSSAGLQWRKTDTFTVIRCPAGDAARPPD